MKKTMFSVVLLSVVMWCESTSLWASPAAVTKKSTVDLVLPLSWSWQLPSIRSLSIQKRLLAQQSQDPSASGEMLDDDKKPKVRKPPAVTPPTPAKPAFRKYGLELRGGMLFFPEFALKLFFDEAEGITQGGFGVGFVLKTDPTFEYVFGVGYHFFGFMDAKDRNGKPIPHVFNNKDEPTYQREFVQNDMSYLAFDVRFQKLFPIHPRFHFLVGAGIGLGVILGGVKRTDTFIPDYDKAKEEEYKQAYKLWRSDPTNQSALPNIGCNVQGSTPEQQAKYNAAKATQDCKMIEAREDRVPPVIPVFDFIVGMVFPIVIDRFDLRIQGGIGFPRLFWVSLASHIYF